MAPARAVSVPPKSVLGFHCHHWPALLVWVSVGIAVVSLVELVSIKCHCLRQIDVIYYTSPALTATSIYGQFVCHSQKFRGVQYYMYYIVLVLTLFDNFLLTLCAGTNGFVIQSNVLAASAKRTECNPLKLKLGSLYKPKVYCVLST